MVDRTMTRRLYRSRTERQFFGVAGGLGQYCNVDPTLIRLALVFATFLTFPITPIVYIIAALVIPQEPQDAILPGDTFSI